MKWRLWVPPLAGILIAGFLLALPVGADERVRESALAGAWYPGDPRELEAYVDDLLDAVKAAQSQDAIRALIVPHAGYRYSGATAAQAFALVRGRAYRRVIVLAPSHRSGFQGLSIAKVEAYETPLGRIPLDTQAIDALRDSGLVVSEPAAHEREHAIEIELPLLQRALAPGWELIPVLVGRLDGEDYAAAADLLRPLADAETLVVVSSDFTHFGPRFGYLPFPPDEDAAARIRALDEGAIERILEHDGPGLLDYRERTGITICGYRPLALLLYLLPADASVERLAYTTSGELTGDYRNSVSYVAMAVRGETPFGTGNDATRSRPGAQPGSLEATDLRLLHRLASLGIDYAVLGPSKERISLVQRAIESVPQHLRGDGGAFVTLWRGGQLRGCMGYMEPSQPLYRAVLENGANAAAGDRRFPPVQPAELDHLEVEISVLSPPTAISSDEEFRVGEHGVILRKGDRRGLYLPEVAKREGWTREETLSRLARKAGLTAGAWREGAILEVFSSTKYGAPYQAYSVPASGSARIGEDAAMPVSGRRAAAVE